MQMIMFFVDSDETGATHITRTTKRTRRRELEKALDVDRPAPGEMEVLVVDQRADRLALPKRLAELDAEPVAPSRIEEEEIERWDGLY